MLSSDDKRFYAENGYLLVEDAVTPEQLDALRAVTYRLIDESRKVTESDGRYDLDEGHSSTTPRLTRIKLPHKVDQLYWDVLRDSRMTEVTRDLLGPDVMIQTSKLNTKAPGGGAAVEWHQDWAFYPHTNDSMLAFGLMLEDVEAANGPLQVIPGSHKGPVLSHANPDGIFCGAVDPDDPEFEHEKAITLTGKAGSMTVHHARMLHGSAPNVSDRNRLILFYELRAADAWPLVGSGSYMSYASNPKPSFWKEICENVVIGQPITQPRMEVCPVRVPMPPTQDNSSIFKVQKTGGAKSAFAAE
ncbi:MAG: phytanoyl-CoA dioxygenase family protein [Pseudomonadota bacterium]